VRSRITTAAEDVTFGLLHFGGHDFNCSLRGASSTEGFAAVRDELMQTYETRSLTDVVHALDRHFDGRYYGLPDIFLEGRRAVLGTVTGGVLAELEQAYERFHDENRKLFDYLQGARFPLPDAFARTIEFALTRRILRALEAVGEAGPSQSRAIETLDELVTEVGGRGVRLSEGALRPALTDAVARLGARLVASASPADVETLARVLATASRLGVAPDLWGVQNTLLLALEQGSLPPSLGEDRRFLALLTELGIAAELGE
jgi:hypothetical protein